MLKRYSWFLAITGLAAAVTMVVAAHAWWSEDCFITLRYVANVLGGHGAVFNPGEYVQGYTHPLWFVLLFLVSHLLPDPMFAAMSCSLALTFIAVIVLGRGLLRLAASSGKAVALLGLCCLVFVGSEMWVSFQTSGLENALSHLLIIVLVIECGRHGTRRQARITLLCCLLCLTRPDFVVLTCPVMLCVLARVRRVRDLVMICLAGTPAIVWLCFAAAYYGDIIPNTAYAKVGMYVDWVTASRQGMAYVGDWFKHDTMAAGAVVAFAAIVLLRCRSRALLACLSGALLHVAWVIWVGGDFMRGRMLLPTFVASVALGAVVMCEPADGRPVGRYGPSMVVAVLVLLFGVGAAIPDPGAKVSSIGIVDERAFYEGYHLAAYRENGRLIGPYNELRFADALRAYAEKSGGVTIHSRNPGTLGYLAGPDVAIIDTLGLTDSFIAKLPRSYLVNKHPRPGHPDKHVPVAYLASRNDISIIDGWVNAVYEGNTSIVARVAQFRDTPGVIRVR